MGVGALQQFPILTPGGPVHALAVPPAAVHKAAVFVLVQFPPPGHGFWVRVGVGVEVGAAGMQQFPMLTPGGPAHGLAIPPAAIHNAVVFVFAQFLPLGQVIGVGVGVGVDVGAAGIQQFPKPRFPVQNWGVPPAATQRAFVL